MIFALYFIGSTAGLVILSARLRETQAELARVRRESGLYAEALADEYAARATGLMMAVACLLSLLTAVYRQPRTASPSAGATPAGTPGNSPADGESNA